VAIAYAVTYVFGSLGAIIVCVNILPKFMGQSLRDASIQAERELSSGAPSIAPGQLSALPEMVGRAYKIDVSAGKTVKAVETQHQDMLTIERIKRDGQQLDPTPDLVLKPDDVVLVVGRREAVVAFGASGGEVAAVEDIGVVMQTREAVFTRKGMNHTTIAAAREVLDRDMRHGVYIQGISRAGQPLPILPETKLEHGDVITFYGSPKDTKRAVDAAGYELPYSIKTDFIYMGVGIVLGLLIGLIVIDVGGIPLTLGSGGGCLLAGLLFGWMRGKHPMYGVMPTAASQLLKDFGLAAFVAVVGLNSGLQAVVTVKQSGMTIFLLGVFVTLFPLLLTMLFGRYVLKYNNAAILAGALTGSRSANPAFGGVLDKAESAVPTVPFAITYAIANVALTLLGPLVVGLV
jgi:putative transport protein